MGSTVLAGQDMCSFSIKISCSARVMHIWSKNVRIASSRAMVPEVRHDRYVEEAPTFTYRWTA